MSVQSEVESRCCEDVGFPKLMQSCATGVIVLFTSPWKGTIVSGRSSKGRTLGAYGCNWGPHAFKDFRGSVTLTND